MAKKTSIIGEGLVELEQAFKQAQAARALEKEKFPLELKRAKPKTTQEIINIAERVARQQAGEHVTKEGSTMNLAGRSKKESERLKELPYTLERTKEIRPTPTYESKVGDVNMALPGDQTISDFIIVDVNGRPIGSTQQGGSLYGEGHLDKPKPLFWASGPTIAQQFQDKVTALSQLYNTDKVMAHHLAMGPVSNNFAMHMADANLKAINSLDVHPSDIEAFNNLIRAGYKDQKGHHTFPEFAGVENPDQAFLQMMEDPKLRKFFNNRIKVPKVTNELNLPSGLDIQYAATEPELRNMEVNLTGHSVGKMVPNAELTDTADHNTYLAGIQGRSEGKAEELAPFEMSFPDATDYVMATQRPQDFTGTIQKVFPHQIVDQQQLDQMSEYYRRLREIRGFAKGGKIGETVGVLNELEDAYREAKAMTAVNRIDMNYKDVTKRVPELTKAANLLDSGELDASEYDKIVNTFKPVEPYSFVPAPATFDDAMRALNKSKQPMYGKTADIPAGEQTDLRLDIPSYKDHGVWINSIHRKDAPTVYDSVSSVKNATMIGAPDKALKVAKGGPKAPFAVIRGEWNPIDQEDAVNKAKEYLTHPEWTQVGYDPERHGYFYDRNTMEPIDSAEEIIQIGPLVLAKKPVYSAKSKHKYAKGGSAKADPVYNGTANFELPDARTLQLMAEIIARKGSKQLKKEWSNVSPRTLTDIAANVGASIAGMPSDLIQGARGTPMPSYQPYKGVNMTPTGTPMAGTENIKRVMKDTGITSGIERPLSEGIASLALPYVGEVKNLRGLPVGMSIEDVGKVPFVSTLAKTVHGHKMEAMPGPQWSAWLNSNAPRSAKKEAEATGLHEWLKTQPKVTKHDIEEHMMENMPKIKVTDKGAPTKLTHEQQVELSDLGRRHSNYMHGMGEELSPEDYSKYMQYSNIDEKANVANLRHQAGTWEAAAQQAKQRGDNFTASVNFNRAEHYLNRAYELEDNPLKGGHKWETYTLPGGENYRETTLNLPRKHTPEFIYDVHGYSPKTGFKTREEAQAYADEQNNLPKELREQLKTVDPSVQDAMERAIQKMENFPHQVLESESPISRSKNPDFHAPRGHSYDDPDADINRVMHMRMKDRQTPEGKKALFLEELQSDWAQQGRDEGFRRPMLTPDDVETMLVDPSDKETLKNIGHDWTDEHMQDIRKNLNVPLDAPYVAFRLKGHPDNNGRFGAWSLSGNGRTPEQVAKDASKDMDSSYFGEENRKRSEGLQTGPYVTDTKDWTALGLKHALKRAVDEGHDTVAWATGSQNAKHYNLSKQINEVHYSGSDLKAYDHNGNEVVSETGVRKEDLPTYIGKEATEKLLAQPMKGTLRSLRGQELEVGGEGMRGYYDQIVPQTMNDIMKQIGAKERVKPVEIVSKREGPKVTVVKNEGDYGNPETRPYVAIDSDGQVVSVGATPDAAQKIVDIMHPSAVDYSGTHQGIEITPELRDKILNEGLPHFHEGGNVQHSKTNLKDEFKISRYGA